VCSKCGREYEATIAHRTGGTGCKICGFKKLAITKRKKAAERTGGIKDELLLKEWDYNKNVGAPVDFAPGSSKKVWWKCHKCEYEWQATVANRSQGKGCPCCANRVVVSGKNDLATLYPKLAQEWDYERNGELTPDLVGPGHNAKVWWKCLTCGQSYQAPPCRRALQDSGCRKCADKNNWTIRRAKAARKEFDKGQLFFDI
jgi:DNA-directed RNA polymerase subunit RPC12/RpoP